MFTVAPAFVALGDATSTRLTFLAATPQGKSLKSALKSEGMKLASVS
jgi:hypothetical protein